MYKTYKFVPTAILLSILLSAAPMLFLVEGQIQSFPAEQLVTLAERAGQQIQNLIEIIEESEEAILQIESVGLSDQYSSNVTLYETKGLDELANAQEAIAASDYEIAVSSAIEALRVFREVFSSIQRILEAADLQKGLLIENRGLLEAITRELQRLSRLEEILPTETPEEILDLLDSAAVSLNEAKTLLLAGDEEGAMVTFLEARQNISEIYQYLKALAEQHNPWRLSNYCDGLQTRIQEKFRYGKEQGIGLSGVLESIGYQSENEFMNTLESIIQTAKSQENFSNAIRDCESAGQMVQEMEQALNQEMNRAQRQYGTGGSNYGYGDKGGSP